MIDQLCVGKRYRVQLRSPVAGYLEGLLRSTTVPRGALGNDDGEHTIWISGELFDWFLRTTDIRAIDELDQAPEAPVGALPRPLCAHGAAWVRHRRRGVETAAAFGSGGLGSLLWCRDALRRGD